MNAAIRKATESERDDLRIAAHRTTLAMLDGNGSLLYESLLLIDSPCAFLFDYRETV